MNLSLSPETHLEKNSYGCPTFQQLTIKEGTAAYKAWVETPVPVYTKFYFFDMLNPTELFHKHEKPILEERGPYVFRWAFYNVALFYEL